MKFNSFRSRIFKNLFSGIAYNFRGLKLAVKTPGLLVLGLVRLVIIVVVTLATAALILEYHQEILNLIWNRPENDWIVWLWRLVSWLVALLLVGLSTVLSFLISQFLFSVIIMDAMSRMTEQRLTGGQKESRHVPWLKYFFYLLRQEIPRAVIPVMILLLLMILGWFTPLSPVLTVISSLAAGIFLAWDNTDLVPARRLEPFGSRFKFLLRNLSFHLGFGLWFLIPVLNIIFLSFAPVGATLFYVERVDGKIES
jgi:CysZ protein